MKKCWTIKNEAGASSAEVLLYGEISQETWFGDEVTPKAFAEDLEELGGKDILVRINSLGGDVFAAQAIYNLLKAYAGKVSVVIDGIAASAATIVASAGEKVTMPSNALFMIHNPACGLCDYYDAHELDKLVAQLKAVKDTIVNVYLAKCKNAMSADEVAKLMDDETWLSAEEAQKCGLVDVVDSQLAITNSIKGHKLIMNNVSFDLSKVKNADKVKALLSTENKKEEKVLENQEKNFWDKLDEKITAFLGESKKEEAPAAPSVEDAVQAERERITALDELAAAQPVQNTLISEIVDNAKKDGKKVDDVKDYVEKISAFLNAKAVPAKDFVKDLVEDQKASGSAEVEGVSEPEQTKDQADKAYVDMLSASMSKEYKNLGGNK